MTMTEREEEHRIVVGVDGSECSNRALDWAADEAQRRHALLHIVHSFGYPVPLTYVPLPVREYDEVATQIVEESAARVAAKWPAVVVKGEAVLGPAAEVLRDESKHADMLVVGSRGRGELKSVLLGSVSEDCAHHAECPVVILH